MLKLFLSTFFFAVVGNVICAGIGLLLEVPQEGIHAMFFITGFVLYMGYFHPQFDKLVRDNNERLRKDREKARREAEVPEEFKDGPR